MGTPRIAPAAQTANAAQDDHRPVAELRASQTMRRSLIGSERYVDHYYNDPAHHCTYGIGTLVHLAPCTPQELRTPVTTAQIEQSFERGIREAEEGVRRFVTQRLTQDQFDALVSVTYNAGAGGAHPLYNEINRVGPEEAAQRILTTAIHAEHRDASGRVTHPISRGIVNRRHRELAIYQGRAQ